jgi:homoserine kinase type II
MALITPLSLDEARRALAAYGIELAQIEPLAGGSVNSNFRLRTTEGQTLFARIYEEQAAGGAAAELAVVAELARAGVPTPAPLELLAGGAVGAHGQKSVAVFPWVEGEMRCQRAVSAEDCTRLGAALASLHRAPIERVPAGRFGIEALEQRLDRIEREAPAELAAAAGQIRLRLRHYAALRDPALPSGLIHGDLFRDNVIWQGEEIAALIDFESASRGPYLYDLLVCVHAWCFSERFDAVLVRALLSGYHAVRPLSPAELAAAPVEAALGALRFATTRITDYSMRAPAGVPPLRDFRRFLARLAEIEAGVLAAPLAGLR